MTEYAWSRYVLGRVHALLTKKSTFLLPVALLIHFLCMKNTSSNMEGRVSGAVWEFNQ